MILQDGIYVHGMWLDGASWDSDGQHLAPPAAGVMRASLPVVLLEPELAQEAGTPTGMYLCPLYKTSDRAGSLTTTGQSTTYITSIALPLMPQSHPDMWVLQGVALLCTLDT